MWEPTEDRLFYWRKRYYGLWTRTLAISKGLKLKTSWWICFSWTRSFWLYNTLIDWLMDWSGVDYCDIFISCLDSHSDGTHSLQRIHCWTSDGMLNFSKSVPMKKQTHRNAAQSSTSVSDVHQKDHTNLEETISHAEQCTGRQSRASSGRLHLLAGVWQHVVALGFVHQVPAGLWRFDQLLVVHHVQQVAGMDERKPYHGQQLRHMLETGHTERKQRTERKKWAGRERERENVS